MNLQRCPNGHYYDADRYPRCPHCDNSFAVPQGVPQAAPMAGSTVAFNPVITGGMDAGAAPTMPFAPGPIGQNAPPSAEDDKTGGFFLRWRPGIVFPGVPRSPLKSNYRVSLPIQR